GGGGQVEDPAGQHEDDRRQPERERGDQAERVVDRRADVAVGGREQRVDAQHALQAWYATLGHQVAPGFPRSSSWARVSSASTSSSSGAVSAGSSSAGGGC